VRRVPRDSLLIVIAVLSGAATGTIIAAISAPALAIAFWRNVISVVLIAPAMRRSWPELKSIRVRTALLIMTSGLALALHFLLWTIALQTTTVAAATTLVATQLVWVEMVNRIIGRVRRTSATGIALVLVGSALITSVDFTGGLDGAHRGDLIAVLAAMSSAAYFLIGRRVRTELSTSAYTLLCYASCAGVLGIVVLVTRQPVLDLPAQAWALLLLLSVVGQLLGHSILNYLLASHGAMLVSLLIVLEIPTAALVAAAVLLEIPSIGVIAGLFTVMGGLAVIGRPARARSIRTAHDHGR